MDIFYTFKLSPLILTFIGLLGLAIGSFLNVVIVRYPKILAQAWQQECQEFLKLPKNSEAESMDLCLPRSHCMHCKKTLIWYELIPVLSFVALKGRCHHCKIKLSWQYPLVELLSALLLPFIAWKFGMNSYGIVLMVVSELLLVLAVIDFNTQLLPDDLTLSLLWGALLFSLISPITHSENAILGATIGYLAPWLIAKVYTLIRHKEGLGYGDMKLFAALGAWLGVQNLPALFFLAVSLGLVFSLIQLIGKRAKFHEAIPFGPAIIVAGWGLLIWPSLITIIAALWRY